MANQGHAQPDKVQFYEKLVATNPKVQLKGATDEARLRAVYKY